MTELQPEPRVQSAPVLLESSGRNGVIWSAKQRGAWSRAYCCYSLLSHRTRTGSPATRTWLFPPLPWPIRVGAQAARARWPDEASTRTTTPMQTVNPFPSSITSPLPNSWAAAAAGRGSLGPDKCWRPRCQGYTLQLPRLFSYCLPSAARRRRTRGLQWSLSNY